MPKTGIRGKRYTSMCNEDQGYGIVVSCTQFSILPGLRYHIISYHIISYHIISYHIMYHIISNHTRASDSVPHRQKYIRRFFWLQRR